MTVSTPGRFSPVESIVDVRGPRGGTAVADSSEKEANEDLSRGNKRSHHAAIDPQTRFT